MTLNNKLSPKSVDDFKLVQSAIEGDEKAYEPLSEQRFSRHVQNGQQS
jgi:hypothetical protein